ncbi:hypothetical protein TNCV_730701 [Trichonephila clavipes]|nr:hypothetical protein TNCV_730701 [Trichonephila clavipes]
MGKFRDKRQMASNSNLNRRRGCFQFLPFKWDADRLQIELMPKGKGHNRSNLRKKLASGSSVTPGLEPAALRPRVQYHRPYMDDRINHLTAAKSSNRYRCTPEDLY